MHFDLCILDNFVDKKGRGCIFFFHSREGYLSSNTDINEYHICSSFKIREYNFFPIFSETENFYYLEGENSALLCGNRTDAG